jgi:hypothetical protein
VRLVLHLHDTIRVVFPRGLRRWVNRRLDPAAAKLVLVEGRKPSFDLLRASVNLMVASAVISYATANKLPLSTTYVTFMVAMGSSFADRAWGRESAVYRVTGVLTVIGGWFMTAIIASTSAALFATVIYFGGAAGVIVLLVLAGALLWNAHRKHQTMVEEERRQKVFNLETVKDARQGIETSFEHMGFLLKEIRESLDVALDALFNQEFDRLGVERKKLSKTQNWANIISANVFKAMRLLDQQGLSISHRYPQTIRRLQKLADGHRDIVLRAYTHVGNHHKGLLSVQVEELEQVRRRIYDILLEVEETISRKQIANLDRLREKDAELREFAAELNTRQIARIHNNSSKTRLSILYYAIIGNAMMLSKQNLELLEIFDQSFGDFGK